MLDVFRPWADHKITLTRRLSVGQVEARILALETHVKELHSERDALLERIGLMTQQISDKEASIERLMGSSDEYQRRAEEVEATRVSLSQRMEETTEREEEAREMLRFGASFSPPRGLSDVWFRDRGAHLSNLGPDKHNGIARWWQCFELCARGYVCYPLTLKSSTGPLMPSSRLQTTLFAPTSLRSRA